MSTKSSVSFKMTYHRAIKTARRSIPQSLSLNLVDGVASARLLRVSRLYLNARTLTPICGWNSGSTDVKSSGCIRKAVAYKWQRVIPQLVHSVQDYHQLSNTHHALLLNVTQGLWQRNLINSHRAFVSHKGRTILGQFQISRTFRHTSDTSALRNRDVVT